MLLKNIEQFWIREKPFQVYSIGRIMKTYYALLKDMSDVSKEKF